MSTIIHTGAIRSGTGFEVAAQPRTQTSVAASIAEKANAVDIHEGKPQTIATVASNAAASKAAVQRQSAARPAEQPTTSYNAQGQVHAIAHAQPGQHFHATV